MAASSAKLILVFILLVSVLQIEARQSKFFSKVTHFNTNNNVAEPRPSPYPAPAPAPELAPFPTPDLAPVPAASTPAQEFSYPQSENGYGLYGTRGKDQFTSTTDEIPTSVRAESFETGHEQNKNSYSHSNGGNPTSYNSNYGYHANNNDPNGFSKNYNYNGYEVERQGMSDTRFSDNGRYYPDVKNENNNYYNAGYESERGSSREDQSYYGGSQNPNEFNTMEEYYKYQESQHYVP